MIKRRDFLKATGVGGHPAGGRPILVMDVFEHAYMIDYGLKKADYIEAFFKAVDWTAVESRLK